MAFHLSKGQSVNLDKDITFAFFGFNWEDGRYDGNNDFDIDASAFLLGKNGKVRNNADFVFFNNLEHNSGSVRHQGDSMGCMDCDDDQIFIDFSKVPAEIEKIVFTATIYEASARKQNFGQVTCAYARFVRLSTIVDEGTEVLRFDLREGFSTETGIVVCEIYRSENEWVFKAVGTGYHGDLKAFCECFGVNM